MHSLTNFNAGSTIFLSFSYLVKLTYQADEINVYLHLYYSLFYIFANRTDTVRTVSSGKTETDQSNVLYKHLLTSSSVQP